MSGRWPKCSTITRTCPRGTGGKWPNCYKRVKPQTRAKRPPSPATISHSIKLERNQRADEIVLLLDQTGSSGVVHTIAQKYRLIQLQGETNKLLKARVQRYRIPDRRSVAAVLSSMKGDKRIRLSQPNHLYQLKGKVKAAALAGGQYAANKIHLSSAHALSQGRKTLIAVIDSAIDAGHPELVDSVVQSFNAVDDKSSLPDGHGTAVAAIIGARAQLLGVAPAARLLAIRAFFHEKGKGPLTTTFILMRAIDWAHSHNARIFNMSFTGPKDAAIERLLVAAHNDGVILTAAAGNEGPNAPAAYPAAYPQVIAVTALDQADKLYTKANRGSYVSVAAPGVNILVAQPGGSYGFQSGTSFAAAHVSGMVALMPEQSPDLRPAQVRSLLTSSASDLGPSGKDAMFGAGGVDAFRSVKAAIARKSQKQ